MFVVYGTICGQSHSFFAWQFFHRILSFSIRLSHCSDFDFCSNFVSLSLARNIKVMLRLKYVFTATALLISMLGASAAAQSAADFIKQGNSDYDAKNYQAAVDDYSKAIAADPNNSLGFRNRHVAYFALRKYDKSLADQNEAIRLKPADPKYFFERAKIFCVLNQLERGMEDVTVAIQLKPDFYAAYRWRALGFRSRSEFDRALEDINAAMKLTPGKAEDYDLRCELNRGLYRNDLAIADANEALRIQPNYAHAYFNRGITYMQMGKYGKALADENAALKCDPKMSEAFDGLSACDGRIGQYDRCAAESGSAAELSPKSADFHAHHGIMLVRLGDLTGGERSLRKASKLQPNNPNVLFGLVLLQIKQHDLASANENLGELRLWADRYDGLGRHRPHEAELLLEMNRPNDALAALDKISMKTPGTLTGEKLAIQSRAHRMLGNSKLADSELAQAKAMLPESIFVDEIAKGTGSSLGNVASSKAMANGNTVSKPGSANAGAVARSTSNGRVRDKWALVIGVSKFAHPEYNLHFSAKDALDFYHFLVNDARFPKDHVLLLLNEQATRENIMNAFGDEFLPSVSEPDDMVVIFVSTHGTPSKRDKGGRNYIVAYDTDASELYATGVDMDELYRRIKEGVKTDRALIVMDACYSGAGVPGAKSLGSADNFDANDIALGSGHLVLSSSSPNERSWESMVSHNGVFTEHLINSLKANNTRTDIKAVYDQIKNEVSWEVKNAYGEAQTPQLGGDWQGKELILSVPASENRQIYNPALLKWIRTSASSADQPAVTGPASIRKTTHK